MTTFNLELKGFAELERKLGKSIAPKISAFTFGVGELVRAAIAKAPGPSRSPVLWASEKQRRWYFATRHKRGLSFKYTRESDSMSQRMVASWATEHRGSMDAVVGTKATYAGYVQSDAKQSAQHKATGWITDKMAMAKVQAGGKIKQMWKDFVEKLLK